MDFERKVEALAVKNGWTGRIRLLLLLSGFVLTFEDDAIPCGDDILDVGSALS